MIRRTIINLPIHGALIFDLDGVIADSKEAHYKAWYDLLSKYGKDISKRVFETAVFGRRNIDVLPEFFGNDLSLKDIEALSEEKEVLFRNSLYTQVKPIDGVIEVINESFKSGIIVVVASSAPRKNVWATLKHFKLHKFIANVVCGEDVSKGKPDPEIFLTATNKVNRDINQSVVFEDSPSGVRAGIASNALVVGLETSHSKDVLLDAGATCTISNFSKISIKLNNFHDNPWVSQNEFEE